MKIKKYKKGLIFGIIITIAIGFFLMNNAVLGTTIYLQDIDSGLTSPSGNYRWLDVANQTYAETYRDNYNYTQATVDVTFEDVDTTLHGTLTATNLKPNFAYQLKLVGTPGTPSNERIGLAGRWWQEEWNGTAWTNGHNLNNKGDGSSPNPNDLVYFGRKDIEDPTSPTGMKYKFTGYLVFDYFITDENGNAVLDFETNNCYHVLWKTSQRSHTSSDGPIKETTFDPDPSQPAYDYNYTEQTIEIFGEWERLPIGGVHLQPWHYYAQLILTEESFHGSGGQYAGNWAAAMGALIEFTIEEGGVKPIPDFTYAPPNPENTTIVNFTDLSYDPDGTIVSWWWNFGDQYYSNLQHPVHCYYQDGTYLVNLTVQDNDGKTSSVEQYITVSTGASPTPELSYDPTSYDFGDLLQGTIQATQFEIWNSGTGVLTYSLSETCNWVEVQPTGGTSTEEHDSITVTVNTTTLLEGPHTCDIQINSDGGDAIFTVDVNVIPLVPELAYDPLSYDFGDIPIETVDSTQFDIWNSGTGTLIYSLTEPCDWVEVTPTEGTSTGEYDTITVEINTTDLTTGPHVCDIEITSNGGDGIFTVYVNILPPAPELSYDPTSYDFGEKPEGAIDSTDFEIWNSGTGTLTYSLSETCDWVEVSPTEGTSTGEHDLITATINTTDLTPGPYSCDIQITSNGGSGIFTIYVTVIEGNEQIDQQQDRFNGNLIIFSSRQGAQSFIPTLETLTKVELYLTKQGDPTNDLIISIRDSLQGEDLTMVAIHPTEIQTSHNWVECDVSDISLIPGNTYYIIAQTSGSTSERYVIGFATTNPYPNGSMWFSPNAGSFWINYAYYDFSFKTYGI